MSILWERNLRFSLTSCVSKGSLAHRFNTGCGMKKAYEKPTLVRKDRLSSITAFINSSPPPNKPPPP
jgi:hypothetical protein